MQIFLLSFFHDISFHIYQNFTPAMKFITENVFLILSLLQFYCCPVGAVNGSFASSLIIAGFFLFTIAMIAFHCYLKRQQRHKFEDNLKRRSIYNRNISNVDVVSKDSSIETMVETLE